MISPVTDLNPPENAKEDSSAVRVLVTGPESSGTSLVSRILRRAGAEVAHRSATFGGDWPNLRDLAFECDAVVIVFRDPFATMASQKDKNLTAGEAWLKLQRGYEELFYAFGPPMRPLFVLTYEQLVLSADSIRPLLGALGLDELIELEEVRDENEKYSARQLAVPSEVLGCASAHSEG